MSDRFPTEITIGGQLTAKELAALVTHVHADGLGIEWEPAGKASSLKQRALQAVKDRQPVTFSDCEIANGDIPGTIAFCQKHNLSYVCRVTGKYDFNGEIRWWSPGMEKERVWQHTTKEADEPMLTMDDLKDLEADGKKLEDAISLLESVAPSPPPLKVAGIKPSPKPRKAKGSPFDPFNL